MFASEWLIIPLKGASLRMLSALVGAASQALFMAGRAGQKKLVAIHIGTVVVGICRRLTTMTGRDGFVLFSINWNG